jgi:hypothetical protein
MDTWNDYRIADLTASGTQDTAHLITSLEHQLKDACNKDVVLIAYEKKEHTNRR